MQVVRMLGQTHTTMHTGNILTERTVSVELRTEADIADDE